MENAYRRAFSFWKLVSWFSSLLPSWYEKASEENFCALTINEFAATLCKKIML
jgi:hypothetical protein